MTDATQPRMAMGTKLVAAFLAAAVFALLAFAPFASAASDPVGGGAAKMPITKGFKKKLNKKKVKLLRLKPATLKGRTVGLKVNGGNYDPITGYGKVTTGGGFKLKYKKRTAAVKVIEVNTVKRWVRAKVANATMKFANLGRQFPVTREGFGTTFSWGKVKLTGKAAKRLNNKLGLKKAFKGGNVLSGLSGNAQPSEATILATGTTSLTLSGAALAKLATVGPEFPPASGKHPFAVKLELLPPASLLGISPEKSPIAGFPISGGRLSPSANGGTLQHLGGLKLTQNLEALEANGAGQTIVELRDIWLDLTTNQATVEVSIINEKTPEINQGSLGRTSIADINLAGAAIGSDPATRRISIFNGSAALQGLTAEVLNQVFYAPLKEAGKFAGGDPLGVFSFTAQAQ